MNPILSEIFTKPVGWLAIGGSILMVLIAVVVRGFISRQVREEERQMRQGERRD